MNEVDFEFCEFIEWNMSYVTYSDFCNKCATIKSMFRVLNQQQKRFYKWYVYSHIGMRETHMNAIWEYLNQDESEYYLNLLHLLTLMKHQF